MKMKETGVHGQPQPTAGSSTRSRTFLQHCKPARKFKKPKGINRMPIQRKPRFDYQIRRNVDSEINNQTNCRNKFTPVLVCSKKNCTSSFTYKMNT